MADIVFEFGGLFNSLDESKTPKDRAYSASNVTTENGILEGRKGYYKLTEISGAHATADVGWGMGYGIYGLNEIQKIVHTGSPTGGTFTLTFDGQTTANIDYTATADQVAEALRALSNLDDADIRTWGGPMYATVQGSTVYSPVFIEFVGNKAAQNVSTLTAADALTGGSSPEVTVTVERTGGNYEALLPVVQPNGSGTATLYEYDLTTVGASMTSLMTGLQASNWYFQAYGDSVYGVNALSKAVKRRMGASTTITTRPKAPTTPPAVEFYPMSSARWPSFGSRAFSETGFSGTETFTEIGTTYYQGFYVTSTADEQGEVTITVTSTADLGFYDWYRITTWPLGYATITEFSIYNGSTQVLPLVTQSNADTVVTRYFFQFEGNDRNNRRQSTKHVIKARLNVQTPERVYFMFDFGLSWMHDEKALNPWNGQNWPPSRGSIHYAYTYFKVSDGTESDMSPPYVTKESEWYDLGWLYLLSGKISNELTGSDRIHFYRREQKAGKWRRLVELGGNDYEANTGTVARFDGYMEYEIRDFREFEFDTSPLWSQYSADVIGAWKQCMAVGARGKCYLSRVGGPEQFAGEPDDTPPDDNAVGGSNDQARGRTDYVSGNRSDEVMGLHGQDSLYAIGRAGIYAMVGDRPAQATGFRQLPGSRGTQSKRGSSRYGGGVLLCSNDGFWYYAIGRGFRGEVDGSNLIEREETEEVRRSWRLFLSPETTVASNSGTTVVVADSTHFYIGDTIYFATTKTTRTISNKAGNTLTVDTTITATVGETVVNTKARERVFTFTHNDELWAVCDTRFMKNNRNRKWEEGTLAHAMRCAVPVANRGIYMQGQNGKIYFFDGIQTTDDGTAIAWSYSTGILEGERVGLAGLECEVENGGAQTLSLAVTSYDINTGGTAKGSTTDTHYLLSTKRHVASFAPQPAPRYKFTFTGTSASDKVKSIRMASRSASKNKGS